MKNSMQRHVHNRQQEQKRQRLGLYWTRETSQKAQ